MFVFVVVVQSGETAAERGPVYKFNRLHRGAEGNHYITGFNLCTGKLSFLHQLRSVFVPFFFFFLKKTLGKIATCLEMRSGSLQVCVVLLLACCYIWDQVNMFIVKSNKRKCGVGMYNHEVIRAARIKC